MIMKNCSAAPVSLSIAIKALNEESGISRCIESVLAEAEKFDCEVVLADSISSDRTVEIAAHFPVRIVQLAHVKDRGCGAAAQLAYASSRGKYFYLIDADMTLEQGFLSDAINYLDAHPEVAGVSGLVVDSRVMNAADERRQKHYSALTDIAAVSCLGGGGLYRRSAIEKVGYFSHRGLHACEEAELGARLLSAGYRLVRLPIPSVRHTGHNETTQQMLRRLWRNKRMQAYGAYLRSALGKPWWWNTVNQVKMIFVMPALYMAAAISVSLFAAQNGSIGFFTCALAINFLAIGAMSVKKLSLKEGAYSVLAWHMYSIAAVSGLLIPIVSPTVAIESREIK